VSLGCGLNYFRGVDQTSVLTLFLVTEQLRLVLIVSTMSVWIRHTLAVPQVVSQDELRTLLLTTAARTPASERLSLARVCFLCKYKTSTNRQNGYQMKRTLALHFGREVEADVCELVSWI